MSEGKLVLAVSIRQILTRDLNARDGGHVEFAGAKIDHALGMSNGIK